MDGVEELPPGWAWARLGDLIDRIESGKNVAALGKPPSDGEIGIIKISAVTWGEFNEHESKTLVSNAVFDPADVIAPGDFLISRANTLELVGAPVIVKTCRRRLVLSDKVLRLRFVTEGLDRWVELFLKSRAGRRQIESYAQGAQLSMRNISQENLRRILVPIAPADEMRRVLACADAVFGELDAAEAGLTRARGALSDYRASLLHAACTGALTAAWRAATPRPVEDGSALLRRIMAERRAAWERAELARLTAKGKPAPGSDAWKARYQEPQTPDTDGLPGLPDGWVWATVDQIGLVSGGLTKNASRSSAELQRPYLRVANVGEASLDLADLRTIGVTATELDRVLLQRGDVLIVEGNGSADQIGRVAMWDGSVEGCIHQNHLIKVRPALGDLGAWLLAWFMSPFGKQFVQAAASSTSGLHTLSITKISALPVPLPNAGEMEDIGHQLPDLLAAAAVTRGKLVEEAAEAVTLRQSILHAAFTGRLVPQDPADEPATTLITRLRTASIAPGRAPRRARSTQDALL